MTLVAGAALMMTFQSQEIISNLKLYLNLYDDATEYLALTDDIKRLAVKFQHHGIRVYDSLHLATAEINGYDHFLTTDRDFCRDVQKLGLKVRVFNPVEWILKEVANVSNSND